MAADRHLQTLALHGGGFRADPATGAVAPPIYLTTSYQFHDTGHAERMFALQEVGFTYTRTGNPTRDIAERRLAALEGGAGALIVASGAAARLYALLNLAEAGDNLVVAADIEGLAGLETLLRPLGIVLRAADPAAPESFAEAADARTRAFFAQSIGCRDLRPFPVAAVAGLGRALGIPLLVDNSLAPAMLRPLTEGAAAVVYSDLGYLTGQAGLAAGVVVDGGNFAWNALRHPALAMPDDSYHGAVWTEVAARFAVPLAFLMRMRMRLLRDLGAAVSPLDVFALLEGVETLALRLPQHAENARQLALWLEGRPEVAGLAGAIGGNGRRLNGLLDLRLSARVGTRLALGLFREHGPIGRASAVLAAPDRPGMLRLAVGLEHPDDLAADLARAFACPD